jgi:hypothetical protein
MDTFEIVGQPGPALAWGQADPGSGPAEVGPALEGQGQGPAKWGWPWPDPAPEQCNPVTIRHYTF